MNTRLFALVLSAPLAFAMGCGGDDDDQKKAIAACQQAGGFDCNRDGVPDNPDHPGGVGTVRSGLVVAQAPLNLAGQPFVGDFYFGNPEKVAQWWRFSCHSSGDHSCEGEAEDPRTLACQGASSCEVEAEGEVTIEFRCPKHLFLPRTVSGDPDAPTPVSWNAPGDWGLAPNGVYRYDDDTGYTFDVSTGIANGEIRLVSDGNQLGKVTGNMFEGVDGQAEYSGDISDDLKTITYHGVAIEVNMEFERVLILVE